jgi:hypothetical protein
MIVVGDQGIDVLQAGQVCHSAKFPNVKGCSSRSAGYTGRKALKRDRLQANSPTISCCTVYALREAVMKSDPIRERREASHYILDYLYNNPDAGDTFEGIMEWWLLTQSIKFEMQTVSEAVAGLVAEGLIVEQKGRDSRSIYRIKETEENRQKISKRLREVRSSSPD